MSKYSQVLPSVSLWAAIVCEEFKEISKDSLSADFKNVTKIYDYVWYGEFGIDQLKFEKLKSTFETVNKSIKN